MVFLPFLYLTLAILTLYFIWKSYNRRKLPPGPRGYPFFGNLFDFDKTYGPHHTIEKWSKEYGEMFMIKLLGKDILVVSGEDLIREVIVKNTDAFAARPRFVRMKEIYQDSGLSLATSTISERWMKVKKGVMSSLKAYGEGLQRIEELTLDAAGELMLEIDGFKQEPFDPQDLLQKTMAKIVFILVYGLPLTDEQTYLLMEAEREFARLFTVGGDGIELEVLPWLKYIRRGKVKEIRKCFQNMAVVNQPAIDTCKGEDQSENRVIYSLLQHNSSVTEEKDKMSNHDILSTVSDIIFAGMSTTSASLHTAIALLVNHPHVQKRIQAEIDDVIGSRVPQLEDRNNMHYVHATILEVIRLHAPAPLVLPHCATHEVQLGGYTLPKGQEVWLNVWSLHHDERYWDEPYVFKPERFLTPEGKVVSSGHEARRRIFAFGGGRRVCIGENMAKARLFILICLLYQRYDILAEDEDHRPVSDPRLYKSALIIRPNNYKIRCIPQEN